MDRQAQVSVNQNLLIEDNDIDEFDSIYQDNCPRFDDNYISPNYSGNDNFFIREARKKLNENREKDPNDKDLNNNIVRMKTVTKMTTPPAKPPSHQVSQRQLKIACVNPSFEDNLNN